VSTLDSSGNQQGTHLAAIIARAATLVLADQIIHFFRI